MSDKFIEDTATTIAGSRTLVSRASVIDILRQLDRRGLLNRPAVMVEDLAPGTHFRANFTHSGGTEFVTLRDGHVMDLYTSDPDWIALNEDFSNIVVLN